MLERFQQGKAPSQKKKKLQPQNAAPKPVADLAEEKETAPACASAETSPCEIQEAKLETKQPLTLQERVQALQTVLALIAVGSVRISDEKESSELGPTIGRQGKVPKAKPAGALVASKTSGDASISDEKSATSSPPQCEDVASSPPPPI